MNPAPSPQKKPGFFRRFSQSTQSRPSVQPSQHGTRSASGPVPRNGTVGGPSYDAIPPTSGSSAFRTEKGATNEAYAHGRLGSGRRTLSRGNDHSLSTPFQSSSTTSTPIASAFSRAQPAVRPPADTEWRSSSDRNPIHPALASPPRTLTSGRGAYSPYASVNPTSRPGSLDEYSGLTAKQPKTATKDMSTVRRTSQSDRALPVVEQVNIESHDSHSRNPVRSQHSLASPPPQYPSPAPPLVPHAVADGRNRPTLSPLHIPRVDPQRPSRSIPRSQSAMSKFADAENVSNNHLPAGAQAPAIGGSPHHSVDGRQKISARRTASASHEQHFKPETRSPSSPSPNSMTPPIIWTAPPRQVSSPPDVLQDQVKKPEPVSEASAYARAVAASMAVRPMASSLITSDSITSSPSTLPSRRVARPLPAPPSKLVESAVQISPRHSDQAKIQHQKNGTDRMTPHVLYTGNAPTTPLLSSPLDKRVTNQSVDFEFPRSPTLPPLNDPRQNERAVSNGQSEPADRWAPAEHRRFQAEKAPQAQLPPRVSSTSKVKRTGASPLSKTTDFVPVVGGPVPATSPLVYKRPPFPANGRRPPPSLLYVMACPRIQATLLSYITINSFLSLIGSSDIVRRRCTGEGVGRWVMKEWAMQLGRERGRSWPNLTVWEGFLESLLHDPSTYSTYPPQWYSLLQHLSLSHTLIVLHLRQLPAGAFPNPPPLSFDDDPNIQVPSLPFSPSTSSFGSTQRPRSRLNSVAGSDAGSVTPSSRMPRQIKLMEIVMPEPLASQPSPEETLQSPSNLKPRRRGSIGSIASVASMSFGRRRSNSTASEIPAGVVAAPMLSAKGSLPPVSYPTPKRYGFTRHGEPSRARTSSDSGRPGSVFSVQSSPSVSRQRRMSSAMSGRGSFAIDRQAPPVPGLPGTLGMPPPIGGGNGWQRGSVAGSEGSRRSDYGGNSSPINGSTFRRDFYTPPFIRVEPAFDRPIPFTVGRAPMLRVFVPLSEQIVRWPSAEGCAAAVRELEKCGAFRRLKLGDLVVNTALRQPENTEHILVFVSFSPNSLVPLDYTHSRIGHLPPLINGFDLPPSYYHPLLSAPQILYLDLGPFAQQALQSIRLAYDRRDVTVATGARLSAKRYLHVAGFEIKPGDKVAPEWYGMVSLEAEGTAEGKKDIENRLISVKGGRPVVGAWEVMREKCMLGTIWLRLVKDAKP